MNKQPILVDHVISNMHVSINRDAWIDVKFAVSADYDGLSGDVTIHVRQPESFVTIYKDGHTTRGARVPRIETIERRVNVRHPNGAAVEAVLIAEELCREAYDVVQRAILALFPECEVEDFRITRSSFPSISSRPSKIQLRVENEEAA